MRPVILITSCGYHLQRNEHCRNTWIKRWRELIEYRFVLGSGNRIDFGDELIVQTGDTYIDLPAKIQASHKWAIENDYTHVLKTDCDMFIHIPRLFASGYESYPYSGNFFYKEFAMGAAYWLDKQASEILVNTPLPPYPADGGDDIWVGRVMAENGIQGHHDSRYHIGPNIDFSTCISIHTTDYSLTMAEINERIGQ